MKKSKGRTKGSQRANHIPGTYIGRINPNPIKGAADKNPGVFPFQIIPTCLEYHSGFLCLSLPPLPPFLSLLTSYLSFSLLLTPTFKEIISFYLINSACLILTDAVFRITRSYMFQQTSGMVRCDIHPFPDVTVTCRALGTT